MNTRPRAVPIGPDALRSTVVNPFALIIGIPICDLLIYPAFRKMGFNFTPIKKIAAGFMVAGLSMMCAAGKSHEHVNSVRTTLNTHHYPFVVLQNEIYKKSDCGEYPSTCDTTVNISVWAQTPSFVLVALSEILASIT